MLRVAITGGLGSGKTTIARMFAQRGAHVASSDEMARSLMEPGQAVYGSIVEAFGPGVVRADGALDRKKLAQLAFDEGRVRELEAIVHPAVLQLQAQWAAGLAQTDPSGVAMVETALVFESNYTSIDKRFDRIILVTASDATKKQRFVQRALEKGADANVVPALEADAERRIALQIPDAEKANRCDFIISNDADLALAEKSVDQIWTQLKTEAAIGASNQKHN